MNDNNASKFTCNICGGRELVVTHIWNIRAGDDREQWQEWGPLQNNHHWHYEFKEKRKENAEYETHEAETNRESDEFFVTCENCDREINFGWSQPDRRGLILPVDFSDFDPSKGWPDPKYVDIWQRKGWLQTTNDILTR